MESVFLRRPGDGCRYPYQNPRETNLMNDYLLSLELREDHCDRYDDLYRWVHEIGGYRYIMMQNGMCGKLPGTSFVYRSKESDEPSALVEFVDRAANDLDIRINSICVLQGSPTAMSGYCAIPDWFSMSRTAGGSSTVIQGYAENVAQSPYQRNG